MELPTRSPSEIEKLRQEAEAFRRLSPDERVKALFKVIAAGMAILERSPFSEEIRRADDAHEAEWQRIQKELFARYAAEHQ